MTTRAAQEFSRLIEIMATLRGPDGCPWDREQTIDSLKPFVLEETYEVLEAIDRHDHEALAEELGDFIFEAVFLAQLEAEAGRFEIADSLKQVADKLVRRHPHVFARDQGEPALDSAGQVLVRWEQIKAQERANRTGQADRAEGGGQGAKNPDASDAPRTLLSGIAPTLPALLRAYHIGMRAASVGFDWSRTADVVAKIQEEVDELREVVETLGATPDPARAEEEMGDLLFAIAHLARKLGIEPETALRKANDKFSKRFTAMEGAIGNSGRSMREMTIEELEREWQAIKAGREAG
jgi:MazG family protein